MYFRILGNKLIQLSEKPLNGYQEVIEDERPEEKEGFYISVDYVIKDDQVHAVYELKEIVEESIAADQE